MNFIYFLLKEEIISFCIKFTKTNDQNSMTSNIFFLILLSNEEK